MNDYSPVRSLQEEVDRFKKTKTFNPLLVTNFYVQAGIVLDYVEELEEMIRELSDSHRRTSGVVERARNLLKRNE